MKLLTGFRWLLLCAAAPLLASCATTELTSAWRDPAYQDHPRKIMIIGLLPDPGNKRIFEDEMVRQLQERGTGAFVSYSVLPSEPPADREMVEKVMREQGADSVIIARLMDKKSVTSYVPPPPAPVRSGPGGYYGGSQWVGYYNYQGVRQDEFAVIQTNLYDLQSEKLVWTAASETWMAESSDRLIMTFIDVMVKKMEKDNVIRPGKGR